MFVLFASEGESEYSEDVDDTNLISYQRKASGEYMEVTIDGKTLRSNRLILRGMLTAYVQIYI